VFLLNLITSLIGFICMEIVKKGPFSLSSFLILSLYTLLLNILFGAIGLFLSTLIKRAKPITTFGIGLVLFCYFIYTLSKITESISVLGFISPFKYVDMNVINPDYNLDIWHLAYFVGITLFLIGLSYKIYSKKDIYT